MQFQYTAYALPLIVAAIVSGWVALYSWRYRAVRGAVALAILSLAIAELSAAYALEMLGADLPTKLFWGKAGYLGIVTAPLAWAVFAYNYANPGKRLHPWLAVFLVGLTTTTLLLALTTESHKLIWTETFIEQGNGFSVLGVSHGLWFAVHTVYSYILLLAGAFFLLRSILFTQGAYRGQAAAMIVAVAAPWVGNIIYLSGLSPIPHLDLTPFALTITVTAVTWGIFGFQLLALSPIARDNIVDEMKDGIIVINTRNQIADINSSALRIIGASEKDVIGKAGAEVLGRWPELVKKYENVVEASDEISFGEGPDRLWYELRLSPLYDKRKRFLGRVITIRNITAPKQAEELQHSFLDDMKALQEIHLALSEIDDLDILYMKMIALSQQRLGIDRLGLFVVDEDTDELHGTYGVDEHGNARDERYYHEPMSSLHWPWEVLNSPNHAKVWENAEIYDNGVVVGTGWKTGATLWNGHKAIGYLACDNFVTQKPIRPYESELISILGSTFGHLIERKRAEARQKMFLNDMKALQQVHLELSDIDDLDILYTKMIMLSQQRLGIDRMGLFLIDNQTNEIQGTWGVDADGNSRDESYYREKITPDHWSLEISDSLTHTKLWENAEILDNGIVVGTGWKAGTTLWTGHQAIGYLMCDNFLTHKPARPYQAELISLLGNTFGHLIERKRAEASLQESQARYRQIVENASDIIYRADINGKFTYINPTGVHLMGFTNEAEMLGKHYLETVASNFRHRTKRFYDRQYIIKQKNTYQEFPVISSDGRQVWLGQNVQLIERDGEIVGFQAVARDITDLVEAKDSLALARDQALEASQLKSRWLARVSHELRTPLGGVLGYAELLQRGVFGPLEEKQLDAANQIIESANYLTAMVNELLDQAQLENKSAILRINHFNVRDMVDHIVANMSILAGNKGLALSKTIAPDIPEILLGDRQRLQQILINLVGNAIKFTQTGEVSIHLYCPDDIHWAMRVTDTGAGVPKEAQTYIFEPFRQINNAITRENRGTGLGLSITKQLVDLMQGEITVESEADKGSTFTIILPILKDKETEKNL